MADRANKVSLGILRRIGKFCSVASPRTVSDMSNTPTPQQNHLLAALPAEVQNRLLPYLELVPLTFGTALYECGDTFYHVCFPTDSIVSLLYRMENGASGEISMVGNEDLAEARCDRIPPRVCHGAGQTQVGKTELRVLRRGQRRNRSPAALSASAPCQVNRKGVREPGHHAAGNLTQSSDVAHFRTDHFSESQSFGSVADRSQSPWLRNQEPADAH